MAEWLPVVLTFAVFAVVTAGAFGLIARWHAVARIERRLQTTSPTAGPPEARPRVLLTAIVARYFGDDRQDGNASARSGARLQMVHAGFFSADSATWFRFARVAFALVAVRAGFFLAASLPTGDSFLLRAGTVLVAALLGLALPRVYLMRRQRRLVEAYRQFFPDFLDLLIVCVDAGLSIDPALDRIVGEIGNHHREFALNLTWLSAETKAGRSTIEALENFATRLSLDEAQSMVLALRQSLMLGTSVASALTIFSHDMRERRLLRAEAEANRLPVKIIAPLGLLIFPVILLVVLFPALVRIIPLLLSLRHG
jgi:tight adherence protein C